MRHHVFWVPDADEKLQALIDGADDRNDLILTGLDLLYQAI
jgi:hypothetical protein